MTMEYNHEIEPMQDRFVVVSTIVNWIIASCLQYPMIYAFIKCRDKQFFKQRGFWTTMVFILTVLINQLITVSAFLFNAPCSLWVAHNFANAWMFTTSAERGFLLYVHFNVGVQAQYYVENQGSKGWILKHRSWFHHGLFSITKLIALCSAVVLAIPGSYILLSSPYKHHPFWSVGCRIVGVDELRAVAILIGCVSISCLFGMFCLRKVQENYFIKLELKFGTGFFIFLSVFCFLMTTPEIYNNVGRPWFIVFGPGPFYGVVMITFVSMGFVVIMYQRREMQVNKASVSSCSTGQKLDSSDADSVAPKATSELELGNSQTRVNYREVFATMLKSEPAVKSFEKFLMKELSIENLLFVKAINGLEVSGKSDEEKILYGKEIYQKFVSPEADLEVNISAESRSSLNSIFANEGNIEVKNMTDVLVKAKQEVTNLMVQDSLRRFCRTEDFRVLEI